MANLVYVGYAGDGRILKAVSSNLDRVARKINREIAKPRYARGNLTLII